MAITPNYSWPLPDDTSLVKDGAEAIRDLGNAIDTTVDGLGSGVLVHIEQRILSATASESFNNIFSANFQHYKVIIHYRASGPSGLRARLRNGGVDRTGASDYTVQSFQCQTSTVTGTIATTGHYNLGIGNGSTSTHDILITNPFLATQTGISYIGGCNDGIRVGTGREQTAASSDGLTIFPNSGTLVDGTIDIYGLRTT